MPCRSIDLLHLSEALFTEQPSPSWYPSVCGAPCPWAITRAERGRRMGGGVGGDGGKDSDGDGGKDGGENGGGGGGFGGGGGVAPSSARVGTCATVGRARG